MSLEKPQLGISLHRIEVHAGPQTLDDGERLKWVVQIGRQDLDVIYLGYLFKREADGYGQTQAFAFRVANGDEALAELSREQLTEWGARYAFEALWDTCRRALQMQASAMDFQFDLDVKAPEPDVEFEEDNDSAHLEGATAADS